MSKDILTKGLLFTVGAAIGSLVTWKLVKTKYEQITNEEIDSMKEYYEEKYSTKEDDKEEKLSVEEIRDKIQELRENNERVIAECESDEENKEEEDEEEVEKPYVIEPEEIWEQEYPTITLTYFEADDILADESNKIIKNIDELVGEDFADHFGEYEDDSVYVKNDRLQVYYEILRDTGSYSEYMGIS